MSRQTVLEDVALDRTRQETAWGNDHDDNKDGAGWSHGVLMHGGTLAVVLIERVDRAIEEASRVDPEGDRDAED